jgi:serine protease
VIGLATALALSVLALPAAGVGGARGYGRRASHKILYPMRGARPEHAAVASSASGAGLLAYGGAVDGIGVTTGSPRVYLVFWGSQWGTQSTGTDGYLHFSGDGPGMAPRVQALLSGVGTNGELWSGVMTQYCEGVATGATSCPSSAAHVGYPTGGALAGVWYDNAAATPTNAVDHDIAVEAVSAAGHFGNLTSATNRNAQYVIVSPSGTHPGGFNTPNGKFCAWHDYNGDGSLVGGAAPSSYGDIAFTNLPYIPDMGPNCGANYVNAGSAGSLDGVTIVEGHEYAETVTDQNPAGGWLDSIGYENGDKCAWVGTGGTDAAQDVAFATGSFAMQATFSNDANACEIAHAVVGATANDFSIAASPSTLSTSQGVATTTSLNTTVVSGTPQSIALTSSGSPAGVTVSFGSSGVIAGTSTTLTLNVASTTVPGTYSLTIAGTTPSATHSTRVNLTVTPANDFSIAASPSTLSTTQGVATSTSVTTAATVGSAVQISLSASGVPANVSVTFTPSSVTAGVTSNLGLAVGSATTPGVYAVKVAGAGLSNGATVTHGVTVTLTVTAATGTLGPYAQAVIGDNASGYWRLGETSGTVAADSAGSSPGVYHGATLGQPSLLASDSNKSASFSGAGQYVGIASTPPISLGVTVSAEAWIKPAAVPAAGAFASVLTKPESYSLQFNGPKLEFTIMQNGTRQRLQAPAGAIAAGGTYHVVGTFDGTTQRLYVNGAQVASALLKGAITINTNSLSIGSWNGSSEFFNGTIDEAAVYPVALSATQVSSHYADGTNTGTPAQAQLSISRSGAGNGNVTSSPAGINCGATCSASFTSGTSVTLTAAPVAGSAFTGWSGGGCSGAGTCTLTLNSNTSIDAAFTANTAPTLSVTTSGTGNGNVTSAPAGITCGATCSASFTSGTSITLTASPASGSAFTGWSGGACSGTGTCTLTLNSNTSVNAAFSTASGGTTYPQAVTGDAPISYWRLDETSGTTAADSVGTNPGTYSGGPTLGAAGLLASATDKATTFSGSNQSVKVTSSTALSPTNAVSVEAWIKPAAIPAAGAFASIATKAESYSLQFNGPKLEFTIMQSGTRRRLQAPSGAIAVGTTYHVVGTYDGTTQRLYVNGAQVASAALTGAITANTNNFYIGSWNGSSEFFKGTIDEVAVYPTALTAARVSNHYTTGITSLAAPLQNANAASGQLASLSTSGASESAVASDDGRLFIAFRPRVWRWTGSSRIRLG